MLSTLKRYKQQFHAALTRCFPRTTAYLRDERAAAQTIAAKPSTPSRKTNQARPRPGRPKAPDKPHASGLYPSARLKISPAQIAAMREQVSLAVSAGMMGEPSDEQWAMIVCSAPLARVFAGAGSGKSSTLLLRVVFMLCHLEIPAQQLTVISFTNASCTELRERLQTLLAFWNYRGDASQCVRTFHSALSKHCAKHDWFEQLGAATAEVDNPLTGSALKPAQRDVLEQAYQQAYQGNALFRVSVQRLLGADEDASSVPIAPNNPYRLAGELSSRPLFEHLYTQLDFAQSLGLNLATLDPETLACASRERDLIQTLKGFEEAFEQVLSAHNLHTFNQAFRTSSLALNQGQMAAPLALSHLLIDEFQDISGQIVHWLNAAQRRIKTAGGAISLMAIGDDWQSIYGWRGSSPELFTNFDKHFPSLRGKRACTLYLNTNYRSAEPIIGDAQKLIAAVQRKQEKTCQAAKPTQPGDHGVQLHTDFELPRDIDTLLASINAQCNYAAAQANPEACPVMVLSRRNEPLKSLRTKLTKKSQVKTVTIHKAKGLQAQVAIILDDCASVDPHPLRNALYAASGLFTGSYDQAMQDEALRLGYVAITRGVSRVLWYSRKAQGANALL